MFTFSILFDQGPVVEYRCNREFEALAYAKRIANGCIVICII